MPMEYAIVTRANLQKLSRHEDRFQELNALQRKIHLLVAFIVRNVLQKAEEGATQYIFDQDTMSNDKLTPYVYMRTERYRCYTAINVLPDVVSQLQKQFPDCDITTNPLHTYVMVDWS